MDDPVGMAVVERNIRKALERRKRQRGLSSAALRMGVDGARLSEILAGNRALTKHYLEKMIDAGVVTIYEAMGERLEKCDPAVRRLFADIMLEPIKEDLEERTILLLLTAIKSGRQAAAVEKLREALK
jgi:hypothetical protein